MNNNISCWRATRSEMLWQRFVYILSGTLNGASRHSTNTSTGTDRIFTFTLIHDSVTYQSSFTLRRQQHNFHHFGVVKCWSHKWVLWHQMEVFTWQQRFKTKKCCCRYNVIKSRLTEFRELNEFNENVSPFHEICFVNQKRGYVKKIRLLICKQTW